MTKTFRVQLNIIKKPYDRPVHYKVDGGRFQTADKTVKFNVNAKYIIDFTFRPPQQLDGVTVQGTKLTVDEQQTNEESAVYRTEWVTTGLSKCKKGERQTVSFQLQIRNAGELKTQMQSKFYGEHEMQHACWGTALGYIEYECKADPVSGTGIVELVKEVFR
jgi:hypothetical protein